MQLRINPRQLPFKKVLTWYGEWERPISSISLIGGFFFDFITLTRVDMFLENFWVVSRLVLVAALIIFINLRENEGEDVTNPGRIHFWLMTTLQFFFGGVLGTYLVFYFRSGTLLASWPFFVILAGAFIANERLKSHYQRLVFQISFLFLSFLLFAIYFVPVLLHKIGDGVFILSGVTSLAAIGAFLLILKYFARERFSKSRNLLLISIFGIFLSMNALYFLNLIPPLPLSLKDGGVYQSFVVNGPGEYTAKYEDQGVFGFLHRYQNIHLIPGTTLYAYSAIFSPAYFNTDMVHEWQYYDVNKKTWITKSRIILPVVGGRERGYRTFSKQADLSPGKWRVNVMTSGKQVIGQMMFNVILADTEPALLTKEIN